VCGGKRTAVGGRQRIGLGIYFGVFSGFAGLSVYLLLTDLHGYAYDVGASKYNRSTAMSTRNTRWVTNWVIGSIDDGELWAYDVAQMCLRYMSEADVEDMLRRNDIEVPDRPFNKALADAQAVAAYSEPRRY